MSRSCGGERCLASIRDCVSVRTPVVDVKGIQGAGALSGRLLCGKWLLERVLGVGGTSTVYEARHRNGKAVAVKILHAHLAAIPAARKRFLDEGSLTNKVGHAGVVSVLDDDVADDGTVFLVMDLLHGETLATRLERDGPVRAWMDAVEWMADLLDVLAAAHDNGVIHRDLKPSNVFLTRDGQVKVLDFGIGRVRELHGESHTPQGAILGTPGFMAPEQARGASHKIDERTDLWSVGATMFLTLTGRMVHQGSGATDLMITSATQAAPSIQRFAAVPRAVAEVIDRSLRLDPDERWPDARSMCTALLRAQQDAKTEIAPQSAASHALPTEQDLPVASIDRYPRERPVSEWHNRSRTAVIALAVLATGLASSALLPPADRLASTASGRAAAPPRVVSQQASASTSEPAVVPVVESRAGTAPALDRSHPSLSPKPLRKREARPPIHPSAPELSPPLEVASPLLASPSSTAEPAGALPIPTESGTRAWPTASAVILDRWP